MLNMCEETKDTSENACLKIFFSKMYRKSENRIRPGKVTFVISGFNGNSNILPVINVVVNKSFSSVVRM
jgi:hypothetical protein